MFVYPSWVALTKKYSMELKHHWSAKGLGKSLNEQILAIVNLRPEESQRTWLMLAFYTTTSIGLRWTEDSTVALFLGKYGANWLPLIYLASAVMGTLLVFFYSRLQRVFRLRYVIAGIAPCMFLPLLVLRLGLEIPTLAVATVFLLRLWVDAFYVLNDLNTSIAANHIFNIREIKRAYPIISSGLLVADIFSGFSLPLLLIFVGLKNIIIPVSAIFIVAGALMLLYLSHEHRSSFPEQQVKSAVEALSARPQLSGKLRRYSIALFAFFGLLQIINILIDFQYLTQIETTLSGQEIASFLGVFSGVTGICELLTQLFVSSRVLERFGVFFTTGTLPASIAILLPLSIISLGLLPIMQGQTFFWSLVILKFLDELLRYTFVISGSPLLFQPIPEKFRSNVQILSGGIAEAWGTGIAGALILITLWLGASRIPLAQNWVLVVETTIVALLCLGLLWILRSLYVDLLVLSAGRGKLTGADVDVRTFKQAVVKALKEPGTESDKRSCIDLIAQIDPQGAAEVLAPLLTKLPSTLQISCLEAMLNAGATKTYLPQVNSLLKGTQTEIDPEVFALLLRYIWLAEDNPNLSKLEQFLDEEEHPIIRATAAALLLRQGTTQQKVAGTRTLKAMLTSSSERERVDAVRALSSGVYLLSVRLLIPNLLEDKSLRVRRAMLEMIAATRLEDYYPALCRGLYHKSTRAYAMRAIIKLDNEALPLVLDLATNPHKPEIVRMYAWRTIGEIPTWEAMDTLWKNLETSKGKNRSRILRSLLKRCEKEEIFSKVGKSYQTQVEKLIDEEIIFLCEIYAAYRDLETQGETYANYLEYKTREFVTDYLSSRKVVAICQLLQRALLDLEVDIKERLLLMLKLLYSQDKIQAAAVNVLSESPKNLGRGLEILEHTITLANKSLLLVILDKREPQHKLQALIEAKICKYEQMVVSDRIRHLLTLETLLSDWCLACCFHFASAARIRIATDQIIKNLRHPTSFVREAAIAYLNVASRRVLIELLPQLQKDPHPLIAAQIKELSQKYL
ncbi:hypothetical protein NIES4071_49420 [Calothrix sp. NIES-4071]|nr:hypothetical protein NIES4071_49420 [Calothrix sp. NIES-4071]BAZ59249.1 hypothetical protein NIES4105_49360 [Calothrix sp. NIES-4105]